MIRTPDQRLRVFISSTMTELAAERAAATDAIRALRMIPVLFEIGARPHPPKELYRAYLEQSHIFLGIYWESYGWVAPDMEVSGLEDEFLLSNEKPRLIYIKKPSPEREERLDAMLARIRDEDNLSYKSFGTPDELRELISDDLALMLTERFEETAPDRSAAPVSPLETTTRSLPVPSTPFIGRAKELEDLERLMLRDDVRLVTLTGPGGIGKTRLALETARRIQERFRDGVALVTLAAVADEGLVPAAIALAVGLSESTQRPSVDSLRSFFLDRQMLLVLDNFEQVVAAAPMIPEILVAAPHMKVLITSRSLLQLRGEHEFSVPAMETPQATSAPRLNQLAGAESIQLFVERARAANAGFELTPDNASDIADIVACLDGLPLAIELAAARSKLLPPQAMLKRLSSRLEVLTGGARDAPARQQTLRNALDWDYELLNGSEQELFRRLAVFAGGFTIESALAVTSTGADELDLLELLDSLVVKSLLHRSESGSDEVRFESLKTIREYQLDKLEEAGEGDETVVRFTSHFLALAESGNSLTIGPAQILWLEKLEREHDNLRAALRWAAESDDSETFYRLCAALGSLWELRSYLTEGQYWYGLALERKDDVPNALRAKALHGAGVLARGQGEFERAREYLDEAVHLRRVLGDEFMLGVTLKSLGNVFLDMNERDRARELYDESLYIRRMLGDTQGIAEVLNNLGLIARYDGRFEEALRSYGESLELFKRAVDEPGIARVYMNISEANLELGNLPEATRYCKLSIEMCREMGSRWDMADLLEILATIASRRGDAADAARLFGSAEALREILNTPLPPSERDVYGGRVVDTRSHLDGTTFAVEWAKGREMSYDEAVDYALKI
ncbi:MAG: hypothetical protein QOG54_255 [Actinomycetota bacterium]|jgi:predicted ATPase/Tfp pilus assembly protein PilF|nr:hypothetical protein [Actinomycetota bacterium]